MRTAVILVHGLRTSSSMWRAQVEALTAHGIPVTAIDLPGHGARMGERFTLGAAREAIGDAVEAAAGDGIRPYLCGFSLGGYLAIDWAGRHPDALAGLLAASCGTVPHQPVLVGWRVLARVIHALPDRGRALNDLALRLVVPAAGAADVLAGGVALDVMDDVLCEVRSLAPLHSLRRVTCPVLFVNGSLDHFRLQERRYLAAAPRGRLAVVAGAPHMVSVSKPDAFTRLLLDGYAEALARP